MVAGFSWGSLRGKLPTYILPTGNDVMGFCFRVSVAGLVIPNPNRR